MIDHNNNGVGSKGVLGSLIAALVAGGVSNGAYAQNEAEPARAPVEEISVTGSRIERSGMTSPTPVTVLDATALESMAPTMLIESLDQMPQFMNNSTPSTNDAFASPNQTLNLRGIGANRTLVLLDGRRVVSSSQRGTVDVGLFPEELIERVEVVTGGASAAYGSDAVSGVVNMILDTDFTGLRTSAQVGATERGDRDDRKFSISAGTRVGDNGHLLLSGQYYQADGVRGYDDRDWFNSWGIINNPDPNGPQRLIRPGINISNWSPGGLIPRGPLAGTQFLEGGTPAPFYPGSIVASDRQVGGSGIDPARETKVLVPDQERSSLFGRFSYDFSETMTGYAQLLYGKNENGSVRFYNPNFGPWEATIYDDNAFLPDEIRQRMAQEGVESIPFSRNLRELEEDRYTSIENETFSFTTGLDGEFGNIRYNIYYQYGENNQILDYGHGKAVRHDRLYRALDAVVDPDTGRTVCRSTLSNPNDGCIPMDMFGLYSVSEEAKEYIWGESYHDQTVDQHFFEASAQTELGRTWAGDISVAAGASYREDSFYQMAGPADLVAERIEPNDEVGYRGLPGIHYDQTEIFNRGNPNAGELDPMEGSFNVKEVFGEAIVPLLAGSPLAESLELSLAARYADYSGSGGVTAWKVGLDWAFTPDLRFRLTQSRDTRAGTLSERYDQTGGGGSAEDPVLGREYSFTAVMGGNPEVDPELSDTLTFGLVFQPEFFPGFSMAVDYFDIQIEDAIDQLGVQEIVDQCYLGASQMCARITRSPETNEIVFVEDIFLNVAGARTTGVDIEATYRTPINLLGDGTEDLVLRAFATHLIESSISPLDAPTTDRAGETGGESLPEWSALVSATYTNGPWRGYIQGRYIDSGMYDALWTEGVEIEDNSVDSRFYTNMRVSYDMTAWQGDLELFFHVSNLFDKEPALAPRTASHRGTAHTNEGLFDELGRRYFAGFRFRY